MKGIDKTLRQRIGITDIYQMERNHQNDEHELQIVELRNTFLLRHECSTVILHAKIVQTKGIPKKKPAFSWVFLSAAYPSCRQAKSANERNTQEKARFFLGTPECSLSFLPSGKKSAPCRLQLLVSSVVRLNYFVR